MSTKTIGSGHGGARIGAGRKPGPGGRATQVPIYIPADLLAKLDTQVGEQSRSEYVCETLRNRLRRA